MTFVGGSPLVEPLAGRYQPPSDHNHAGKMVWAADPDGVPRHCWCSECGQEWRLSISTGPDGEPKVHGWKAVAETT